MELNLESPVVALEPGQVLTLDDAEGVRVEARAGTVWVTEEDDREDHIITAGDSIVIDKPGRTVVQALATAWVALRGAVAAANEPLDDQFDSDAYLADVRNRVFTRHYY